MKKLFPPDLRRTLVARLFAPRTAAEAIAAARSAVAAGVPGHRSMRNGDVPADVPPLREELIRYFDVGQKK